MALRQGQDVAGGWQAVALSDTRLVLARPPPGRWEALRRLGFVLIPLVLAGALLAGSWEVDAGLKLAAWPVAALLLAVAVLGVASAARTAARARLGLRLEVDGARRVVVGLPHAQGGLADFRPHLETAPWQEVRQVVLAVHPGGRTGPGLVSLAVELASGVRLLGPEVACPDAELEEARRALAPVAALLADRLAVPVVAVNPPGPSAAPKTA